MADEEVAGKIAVGEITGFCKKWNPFLKKTKVLVKIQGEVIPVFIDDGQADYFRKKFADRSPVAAGFYGGEWHLGSPPPINGEAGLLGREMEGFDLAEMVGRPAASQEWELLKLGPWWSAGLKGLPEDVEQYHDYIRQVESNIKDNGGEILDNLGLSHLVVGAEKNKAATKKKSHNWASHLDNKLDTIISQNNKILANQDELLHLVGKNAAYGRTTGRTKRKFN
ncbi:MAG TPA: hypothetical protein VMC84_03965 [Methanocella sp.]|uniref:hypothetical protein n=1 Tax=Methanocella sp. TaxID=2052833 RepID=UPI002C7B1237|nr:hypothetical protein [Methanocella sp.]HTY90310.1 hypothetical protein [Methanocella sp.]